MNTTELKELAEKATPGEWEVGKCLGDQSRHIYCVNPVNDGEEQWLPLIASTDDGETLVDHEANAAYISAANPAAILELIVQLEDARAQMERQKDEWLSWEAKRRDLEKAAAQLEDAQGEIRALRATEAGLRDRLAAVEADRAQRVPEGWKLVPVEPTISMCIAGDGARSHKGEDMTDWTDAEISRRLALAIGWPEESFYKDGDGSFVALALLHHSGCSWKDFDYRDPAVIWPIAERFDAFPHKNAHRPGWNAVTPEAWAYGGCFEYADTAAKAVALAVIKAKEQT